MNPPLQPNAGSPCADRDRCPLHAVSWKMQPPSELENSALQHIAVVASELREYASSQQTETPAAQVYIAI